MLALVAGIAALAALMWRDRHMRAIERRSMHTQRYTPDGVVVGAAGFIRERANAPAVLLVHGGGDTPQTLRYLGDSLYARGFAVSAPLLPGHGRTLREFARVTADELVEATRSAYLALCSRHEWVGVIGVSMGGALAVQLAADNPEMPAMGLVAPYLAMRSEIARPARWAPLWGPVVPYVDTTDGLSILDPSERERSLAYGAFSAGALRALFLVVQRAAAALPRVVTPTLIIQSRADNRITVADTEHAFARLGAREKRLEWTTGAAHVITVDYGRERVFEQLAQWMEGHRTTPGH